MSKGIVVVICLTVAGAVAYRVQSRTVPVSAAEAVMERQRQLPAAALTALQDLRVLAGAQIAGNAASGGYRSPEQLQAGRFLSKRWPLSKVSDYTIECKVEPAGDLFACTATPVTERMPFFYTDQTTVVRYEHGRRPDAQSAVY